MGAMTSPEMLEEEERSARMRLAACRARLYCSDGASAMRTEMHLREFERKWQGAAECLHRARRAHED